MFLYQCAVDCSRGLMDHHEVSDMDALCNDIVTQRALFLCLANSCKSQTYGPALAYSISECSSLGATIGNLHPVEVHRFEPVQRQPTSITPRSEAGMLSFADEFTLSVACTAGSDGVLTLSLPSVGTSPTNQPVPYGASPAPGFPGSAAGPNSGFGSSSGVLYPPAGPQSPPTGPHSPSTGPQLPSPQFPPSGPQPPATGPQSPATGPQSPVTGPQSPATDHQSPATGPQSPSGPQSPGTGPQHPPGLQYHPQDQSGLGGIPSDPPLTSPSNQGPGNGASPNAGSDGHNPAEEDCDAVNDSSAHQSSGEQPQLAPISSPVNSAGGAHPDAQGSPNTQTLPIPVNFYPPTPDGASGAVNNNPGASSQGPSGDAGNNNNGGNPSPGANQGPSTGTNQGSANAPPSSGSGNGISPPTSGQSSSGSVQPLPQPVLQPPAQNPSPPSPPGPVGQSGTYPNGNDPSQTDEDCGDDPSGAPSSGGPVPPSPLTPPARPDGSPDCSSDENGPDCPKPDQGTSQSEAAPAPDIPPQGNENAEDCHAGDGSQTCQSAAPPAPQSPLPAPLPIPVPVPMPDDADCLGNTGDSPCAGPDAPATGPAPPSDGNAGDPDAVTGNGDPRNDPGGLCGEH
ncbi:hypothetical protein G7Z17_g13682 [Cylindrodendrum hubeiense]|uniref:Uncharacterized protein n=1 Tax=Cylindrodendrum hubeiense TaxID=595255 RepID=A0A9P5GRV2_9HYPO|nr:hypothetical protein G7Z17_g13682 [Cylindrodendrum hubeiense]